MHPTEPTSGDAPALSLKVFDRVIGVTCSDTMVQVISTCWPRAVVNDHADKPFRTISIVDAGKNQWIIEGEHTPARGPVRKAEFVRAFAEAVLSLVCMDSECFPVSAGAVAWDGKEVLILGREKTGKSMLIAWMMQNGFALTSDNDLLFDPGTARFGSFAGPIRLHSARAADTVQSLPDFRSALRLTTEDSTVIIPDAEWVMEGSEEAPAVLVFVEHDSNSSFGIAALSEEDIRAKIANCHPDLTDDQVTLLCDHLAQTPAIQLTYSKFEELDQLLDQLCFYAISVEPAQRTFSGFVSRMTHGSAKDTKVYPIPARTERKLAPKLTIGMATYDDYDGTYFSIQAIRMYHPEILDQVEFLVLDNNPEGPCSEPLKKLEHNIPNYRYVPNTDIKGTAVRDYLFSEAQGQFVLSMDCHVFFVPGALQKLLAYYAAHPETDDLLQGPIIFDDLRSVSTHFVPKWRTGMYGWWSDAEKEFDTEQTPFEIPSQGLGVFTCRKDAWLGFNGRFRGFGGEEGYIHQKFRNAGRKTLCLPFLQWMHRFDRPFGVPYRNQWEDRVKNYLIGWKEVGLPIDEMLAHFNELIGEGTVAGIRRELEQELRPVVLRDDRP